MTDDIQIIDSYVRSRRRVLAAPDRSEYYDSLYRVVRESVPELIGNWPPMKTTFSLQRMVELVKVRGGRRYIVYDQAVGQAFDQFNYVLQLAVNEKAGYSLALKHAGQYADLAGYFPLATICALSHLRMKLNEELVRFEGDTAERRYSRRLATECQEQYALTHELGHLLYEVDSNFSETYRGMADRAMSSYLTNRTMTVDEDQSDSSSKIRATWKELYEPHLGEWNPQLDKARAVQDEIWALCAPTLTEELACDLFAIDRTFVSRMKAGAPVAHTAAAIFLGFKYIRQLQLLDTSSEFVVSVFDTARIAKPRQEWVARSSLDAAGYTAIEDTFDIERGATMYASHLRESAVYQHISALLDDAAPSSAYAGKQVILDLQDRFDELLERPAAFTMPATLKPVAEMARVDRSLARSRAELSVELLRAFEHAIGPEW